MDKDTKLLLIGTISLFTFIMFITWSLPYIFAEKFKNDKKTEIKDFDKNVIKLEKLKYDKPKIKNFKPKKTSELKLFCSQGVNASKLSCYQQ